MKQMLVTKARKRTQGPKDVRKLGTNVYAVQSFTHKQLEYTVLLDTEHNNLYCACKQWKYRQEVCKHILKVLALDVKVMEV